MELAENDSRITEPRLIGASKVPGGKFNVAMQVPLADYTVTTRPSPCSPCLVSLRRTIILLMRPFI